MINTLITVRDWLRYAVSQFNEAQLFFGHGSDNAYDEAAYLILHTLHLPLDRLEPFLDARLLESERQALAACIEQRCQQRLPAAYITGEAWLGDFRFHVDARVIVPRSYFAELLETQLSPWISDPDTVINALDLCTGSGCLAILMAHAFPNAQIDAVDLSEDALAVAEINVGEYGLQEQIELIHSDGFTALKGRKYDLILSNPPYVTADAMADLPEEYRHEPEMALGSGDDGLDFVRHILSHARHHLHPHGILVVEIGHNKDIVENAFPELDFTWLDTEHAEGKVFLLHAAQLPQ